MNTSLMRLRKVEFMNLKVLQMHLFFSYLQWEEKSEEIVIDEGENSDHASNLQESNRVSVSEKSVFNESESIESLNNDVQNRQMNICAELPDQMRQADS